MSTLRFKLELESDELKNAEVPVEVRRPNLALVARTTASQVLVVKPGEYSITATLPAGQQLTGTMATPATRPDDSAPGYQEGIVTVGPDEDVTVILAPDPDDRSVEGALAFAHYVKGAEPKPRAQGALETFGSTEARLRAATGDPLVGNLRFIDNWQPQVEAKPGLLQVKWPATDNVRLIQYLEKESPPLNTLVPSAPGQDGSCIISRRDDLSSRVSVNLANPQADILMHYYARNQLEQATSMTTVDSPDLISEGLLAGKHADPIGASLGVYVLLRLGNIERLHDWTAYLTDWFDWLPDGPAIRGEHLARVGRHREALELFLKLPQRGLPFFSDGLSYAVDRLRLYVQVGRGKEGGELGDLGAAEEVLTRLHRYCNYANFRRPILSFTGLDPTAPDAAPFTGILRRYGGLDLGRYGF